MAFRSISGYYLTTKLLGSCSIQAMITFSPTTRKNPAAHLFLFQIACNLRLEKTSHALKSPCPPQTFRNIQAIVTILSPTFNFIKIRSWIVNITRAQFRPPPQTFRNIEANVASLSPTFNFIKTLNCKPLSASFLFFCVDSTLPSTPQNCMTKKIQKLMCILNRWSKGLKKEWISRMLECVMFDWKKRERDSLKC